ncbi:MAG: rod shape-determining protein MreC [Candidatus Cloacimonetes bacterium]|nr:rod shape-determining protein MreC [Candidatus Cloacimonadota bacterium]
MIKAYRFLIFLILALFLLLGSRESRYQKANFLSSTIYLPFISSVNWLNSYLRLQNENLALHNQLTGCQIELNNLHQELDFYRKQNIDFTAPRYDFVTADVIGSNGEFGQRYYILDQGREAGIKPTMPVLGTEGVIGKVVTAGHNYSLLMPIDHTDFKLGVMLQKNFTHGLLEADLEGRIYMNMMRLGSEVSLGDTIVTSHFSKTFPPFYPVGTVSRIKIAADRLNMSAEIEPFSKLQSMTTVIVLLYENHDEYGKELGIQDEAEN